TGNLTLGSGDTLSLELDGTNPATDFDNLAVSGSTSLGGATLALNLGFAPAASDSFTIVGNGVVPVSGTFAGLPEGTVTTLGTTQLAISYVGGDGNDVVLSDMSATDPIFNDTAAGDNYLIQRSGANDLVFLDGNLIATYVYANLNSITINGGDGNDSLTVDSTLGNAFPTGGI